MIVWFEPLKKAYLEMLTNTHMKKRIINLIHDDKTGAFVDLVTIILKIKNLSRISNLMQYLVGKIMVLIHYCFAV